jgi:hypothetical protein
MHFYETETKNYEEFGYHWKHNLAIIENMLVILKCIIKFWSRYVGPYIIPSWVPDELKPMCNCNMDPNKPESDDDLANNFLQ